MSASTGPWLLTLVQALPLLVIDTTQHRRPNQNSQNTAGAGETSAPGAGVALVLPPVSPGGTLSIHTEPCLTAHRDGAAAAVGSAQDLTQAVDRLTRRCGVSPDRIAAVGVNRGPGSWTGLRMGLSAAKTLAAIGAVPLIALDSLFVRALAWMACTPNPEKAAGRRVLVVQDSGHGQVTRAVYRVPAGPIPGWPEEESPPAMVSIEGLRETFPAGPGILIGVEAFPEKLQAAWQAAFPTLPAQWKPGAGLGGAAATAQACVAVLRGAAGDQPFAGGGPWPAVTVEAGRRLIYTGEHIHPLAPLYLKDPYAP